MKEEEEKGDEENDAEKECNDDYDRARQQRARDLKRQNCRRIKAFNSISAANSRRRDDYARGCADYNLAKRIGGTYYNDNDNDDDGRGSYYNGDYEWAISSAANAVATSITKVVIKMSTDSDERDTDDTNDDHHHHHNHGGDEHLYDPSTADPKRMLAKLFPSPFYRTVSNRDGGRLGIAEFYESLYKEALYLEKCASVIVEDSEEGNPVLAEFFLSEACKTCIWLANMMKDDGWLQTTARSLDLDVVSERLERMMLFYRDLRSLLYIVYPCIYENYSPFCDTLIFRCICGTENDNGGPGVSAVVFKETLFDGWSVWKLTKFGTIVDGYAAGRGGGGGIYVTTTGFWDNIVFWCDKKREKDVGHVFRDIVRDMDEEYQESVKQQQQQQQQHHRDGMDLSKNAVAMTYGNKFKKYRARYSLRNNNGTIALSGRKTGGAGGVSKTSPPCSAIWFNSDFAPPGAVSPPDRQRELRRATPTVQHPPNPHVGMTADTKTIATQPNNVRKTNNNNDDGKQKEKKKKKSNDTKDKRK